MALFSIVKRDALSAQSKRAKSCNGRTWDEEEEQQSSSDSSHSNRWVREGWWDALRLLKYLLLYALNSDSQPKKSKSLLQLLKKRLINGKDASSRKIQFVGVSKKGLGLIHTDWHVGWRHCRDLKTGCLRHQQLSVVQLFNYFMFRADNHLYFCTDLFCIPLTLILRCLCMVEALGMKVLTGSATGSGLTIGLRIYLC